MTIDWQSIAAACAIVSFVIMMATAYLRLFIGKVVYKTRDEILADMRNNFVQKELHRPEMHEIKRAIAALEGRIERLRDQVSAIELSLARHKPMG